MRQNNLQNSSIMGYSNKNTSWGYFISSTLLKTEFSNWISHKKWVLKMKVMLRSALFLSLKHLVSSIIGMRKNSLKRALDNDMSKKVYDSQRTAFGLTLKSHVRVAMRRFYLIAKCIAITRIIFRKNSPSLNFKISFHLETSKWPTNQRLCEVGMWSQVLYFNCNFSPFPLLGQEFLSNFEWLSALFSRKKYETLLLIDVIP